MQHILTIETPKTIDTPKLNFEAILTSFIYQVIKNEVKSLIRKYKSRFEFVEFKDELCSYSCQLNNNTETINSNTVESDIVSLSLDELTERELLIVNYHLQGYTDKEISRNLGLSRQTINKIRLNAFSKIRCSLLLGGYHA